MSAPLPVPDADGDRMLTGKVAIVTGAASGIGRATAAAFAREGAAVIASDVDEIGGRETVDRIRGAGGEAAFVRADVSRDADVAALVRETIRRYGRLDVGFNNAGIGGTSAPTAEMSEESFDQVIAVNLKGVWLCMRRELPEVVKTKGVIVNMSSILGETGFRGAGAYVASKHAVIGITRVAALEYAGAGVRVNAICPAFIKTPMVTKALGSTDEALAPIAALHPIGRLGEPEEIAAAVLWLASPAASFVTGHALVADGGYLAQ